MQCAICGKGGVTGRESALYGMNEDPAKVTYLRMALVKRGHFAATTNTKFQ